MTDEQPTPAIHAATYGKHGIRVLTRSSVNGIGSAREVTLSISVTGDFLESYSAGDNRAVLPSDTLRRHALAEIDRHASEAGVSGSFGSVAGVLASIGRRILASNDALGSVTLDAIETPWVRRGATAFVRASWSETVHVVVERSGESVSGGIVGLELLTTGGSSFTGFMRDALTAQSDAHDRALVGTLDATWNVAGTAVPVPAGMVTRIVEAIGERASNGIQQLLHDAAAAVLAATSEIDAISLRFASQALSQIPAELAFADSPSTFELGNGAVGVTEVALRRR